MSTKTWWIRDKDFLGKHKFRVFVHDTKDEMHAETKDWGTEGKLVDAAAGTLIINGVVTLHFAHPNLELSLVAHESMHAALWSYNMRRTKGKHYKEHSIYTWKHPEKLAELTGNLTSLVWFGIQSMLDEDKDEQRKFNKEDFSGI